MVIKTVLLLAIIILVAAGTWVSLEAIYSRSVVVGVRAEPINRFPTGITRYVDEPAGVVCWVFIQEGKGGISCLPISETKMGVVR